MASNINVVCPNSYEDSRSPIFRSFASGDTRTHARWTEMVTNLETIPSYASENRHKLQRYCTYAGIKETPTTSFGSRCIYCALINDRCIPFQRNQHNFRFIVTFIALNVLWKNYSAIDCVIYGAVYVPVKLRTHGQLRHAGACI